MLQTAAMLLGLWVVWALLTQAPLQPENAALGFAVAAACTALAGAFGGVRESAAPPRIVMLNLRRLPDVLRGALTTARAAIAADVSLKPALIRIKPRPAGDAPRVAFAHALSASPGMLVVESDAEGLLAHTTEEDSIEAHEISALEARVLSAFNLRDRA